MGRELEMALLFDEQFYTDSVLQTHNKGFSVLPYN